MRTDYNTSDPTDCAILEQLIHNYTDAEWQSFQDFVWSEKHKNNFSYDDRNCIKTIRSILRKRPPYSSKQYKTINWALKIIDRIEQIESTTTQLANINDDAPDDLNAPLKNFTLRVAWHDNMWNGTVCNHPDKNIFCSGYHSLLSDRIRREKERLLPTEMEFSGQPVENMFKATGEIPPCFWSVNLFGNTSINVKHKNPAADSLEAISEILPDHSMFSWPFGFSFIRNTTEYKTDGKYPSTLEKVRVPYFRGKIKKDESIGIVYAKYSNPFSYEDMKYLVVGCGKIKDKGDPTYFGPPEKIQEIKDRTSYNKATKQLEYPYRHFPSVNWAIRFSFDPDSMVRMPYHEYQLEAAKRKLDSEATEQLLSSIRVTIDEPELEHCFKFVAMDIDDDATIFILTKMRMKLLEALTHGIIEAGALRTQINKLEELIEYCWNRRTHFPGFARLARVIRGKQSQEKYRLDDFILNVKEQEPDYSDKIKSLLENPKSDQEYSLYQDELLQLKKSIQSELGITIDDFLSLAMLNLSERQFKKIKDGSISKGSTATIKDICKNPYLLFEDYQVDENNQDGETGEFIDYPIELFKIDIGLFPNIDYLSLNFLQDELQVTDVRRIRALIIQHLREKEFNSGDCFDNAFTIENYIKTYPLFYNSFQKQFSLPEYFLEKSNIQFDKHLSEKLHIEEKNDTKYYYLQEIYEAEKEIESFVQVLLNAPEPNTLKFINLPEYLGKSVKKLRNKIGDKFEEAAFKEERTFLYENIFPKKFFVLTGSPGSGKSYETLNIIKYFKDNNESYLLLAPTGKAALRLKFDDDFKDDGIEAMTIDKFIHQYSKEPSTRKRYKNIIIDEMSMIDIKKLRDLLRCFEVESPGLNRIIMVGDPHQLPPIGFGKPFFDIIQYLKSEVNFRSHLLELDVNCRQELEGNAILDFSKLFSNEGELSETQMKTVTDGGNVSEGFRVLYWKDESHLKEVLGKEWLALAKSLNCSGSDDEKLDQLLKINLEGKPKEWALNLEGFQVITPYRYFSDILNTYYQSEIREDEIDIMKLFKHRDKIIRTKNFYKANELLLSNGSIGLAAHSGSDKVLWFAELEDKYLSVKKGNMREGEKDFFELAYSITVHKSQGSGFDHLIVVLPKRYGLLCKELFYTALTRSRRTISILIEGEPGVEFEKGLFEYARRRSFTENRKTSLLLDKPHRHYGLEPEPGHFVQSRVEQIIYRHLMTFREKYKASSGFEFKYEQFPEVNGEKIRIKTDFTIYTKRNVFYWEHLGLLEKNSYKRKWLEVKKPTYEKAGLSDSLITTDELNGINDDKIISIIQNILEGEVGTEDKLFRYSKHHFSLR